MPFVPKNYMTDGGNETVIGGKLTIKPGAKVDGLPTPGHATTTVYGSVKKASKVADAAGEAPTAAEFNALLAALKSAGLMSST